LIFISIIGHRKNNVKTITILVDMTNHKENDVKVTRILICKVGQ